MDQVTPSSATESENRAPIGFGEFVAMVAALMALGALGIDSMLPALPAIAASLGATAGNERQYVITAFMLGFSITQLAYGPLSDRYGRRPVLALALAAYVVTNIVAAASASFPLFLLARAAGGGAIAAARVITVALVRDCFAGRAMARVMSLAIIVFMAAPIIAPNFGLAMLQIGSWRLIFWGIALIAAAVLVWFWLRMPETLHHHERLPLDVRRILGDYGTVLRDRHAVCYTLAIAFMQGGLFGFLGSIQQIMSDVFHQPHLITVVFGVVASTMAAGSFLNSRIVMRFGMRPISHTALTGAILVAAVHLATTWFHWETLLSFTLLQAAMMGCMSLATSNFSAMAMEKMGDIAGTASSLQGFVTTLGGAVIGAVIGQAYNGTTVPLYAGFLLMGLCALSVIAFAERGRLYRPH